MTNKKFKVAAMSMALTACVAAQPLIANAADENINSTDANVNESQSEGESPASAPVAVASASSDPVTNEQDKGAVDVIGDPDISVDYNHDQDKVTKDDSSTTTESTGPVNRNVPIESEPGAQQPSGDGQQGGNHETDLNNEQKGEPETDLNNEQKGEPETDLNNEQEGSKDGGSETEKTPIGEAEKTETETKDTKLVLGEPTTTTTTTTNPDGSTTTTTTTTTDAALETTTKVEGEASAKTEEDSSEDVKKESLKEELDGKDLSWDTEPKTKFGDYTVTDAVEEEDGSKTFTLTKEDKIETGEMTGLDISKLIEAGYTDNGDGTYTLTKEYTDSQGQKHTTTVKVDSSKATKTTSTKLTVRMASQEHEKTEELGTKEDTNYPYPSTDITVKDDKGKEHTFNVTYILGKAHENKDGTFTYEDKENNLTYTITKNETDTNLDSLTDTELRDLLNKNTTGSKYSVDAEGKLCYTTDQGEVCRVTNEQNTLLRSMLKLGITITDHHGKESDTQKVENSNKTPEQAKADAEKAAQDEALKDALAQAINKETGKSLTKADITLPEVRDGKFEWTDTATRKTYTFIYTETGTVSSSPEKISDPTTVKPNASSAEKNTETGSAEVTGFTVIWTDKDQTFIQNDEKTDSTFGKDFDFRSVPGGFELDGEAELNEDGTLKSFKTKDGKTYEFRYEKGSAPEDLKDISNPNFTKVTWTMTEKKIVPVTSKDTSAPTQIEIERNFQKTEDNGTFTFTETKKDGKTYSGLKKVAGEDNLYRNDDGTVTITVTTSELGVNEIRAALEDKGYTEVNFNSDGTVSYKDGNVTYNVTYNTTVESITVKTKEVVKESSTISASDTNQKEAEDALKAKIAELQAGLKEGEYIEVNGHHVDQHTKFETIITYFKTAINYKNMSDAEIVDMLEKQKADADAEHKSYTGAGIGHDYWGRHYDTGETPNYIGHLDLATDSDLLLEDGKTTADAILLNEGDKKFKFEWNMDAEALVNKDKADTQAKFQDSISYDDGKQNGGDGSKGHYEYERQDTGSWIAPDSNNYPHESAYYRLTGTIAYNSLENGKEYDTKRAAEKALEKWRAEHPDAEDYKPNIVALTKTETDWLGIEYETTVYKAYTYESSLTAYGYMSKDSNTCVNSGYGDTGYGRAWAGGFDLRISGLTQVTKTESSAHGKNYYDYYADITKYKTVEQTSRPLANRLLDVIPGTKTVPTETTNTDTGSGLFGSYDQNHNETHNYEKPFTGAGTAEYTTYRTWEDTNAEWDGEFEKLTGAFGFNYTTTKDAEVTEASKKACVKTDSSVKYHYSYVERQELDPITETKTVTTPADDDGDDDDGGDKIIEEKDSDSPVLPGTPELPPVQDAKPDAPVLPADPALPAVQDAHALPQTGVNWLAAIGLALSGMTLMITGAFASLTGKNAKH